MTAALVPDGLEPLGVWDARDSWVDDLVNERIAWAREHIPRVNDTYRAEFYLLDSPIAILYRYAVNTEGRKYALARSEFIADVEPATEPPVVQILGGLPPAHLLARQA